MKTTIFLSACALVALAVPACSSSSGPSIDSVTVTDSPVEPNADGSYTVDISVDFSDDIDVDTYNFDSDAANIHITDSLSPTPAGTFTIDVTLPNGTASGTVDFDVSVVDVDNFVSNDVGGVVVLDQ